MTSERLRELFLTREAALRLLASLALAIILWALVSLRQDPETTRVFTEVPVHATSLDDAMVIVNELEPVRVELSGPRSDVNPIEGSALVANLDFAAVTEPGVYDLPVHLETPKGVWESSVSPPTVSVVVEQSVSKPLPLFPAVADIDENSLRTVTVYPEVDRVTVTGPSSLVDSIDRVVLPVQVSGGSQTFEDVYIPEARDANGQPIEGITIEPSAVAATVRVSARGKSVAVLATITGSPAPGYEIADRTINPQFVVVDGDEDVLDTLVALSTEPVDVTGADASFTQTVNITGLPDGIQILQPSTGDVEVLVQITQRGVRQSLPSQQVTIVGVGPGLVASVNPDEITIEVVAPEDTLADLDASSLQVIVDATGLPVGSYAVQPSVIMPPRVQWVATFPAEVTLTVRPASEDLPSVPDAAGTPGDSETPESAP
ncbi:MAG: CdaR family protein [Thermomicrobiales bacterium]|nr:CdaR family protein [Thermomicrobiales bacterium]